MFLFGLDLNRDVGLHAPVRRDSSQGRAITWPSLGLNPLHARDKLPYRKTPRKSEGNKALALGKNLHSISFDAER